MIVLSYILNLPGILATAPQSIHLHFYVMVIMNEWTTELYTPRPVIEEMGVWWRRVTLDHCYTRQLSEGCFEGLV